MTTLIDALDGAYEHCAKVFAGIDGTQLALPTPCSQWDIRATIDHLIGATWMFTLVNQGQAVGEDTGATVGRDPVVAITDAAAAKAASWRTPARSTANAPIPSARSPLTRPR
jgi:hypothetical protein